MPEGDVGGLKGAQATAVRDGAWMRILALHQWHNLVEDVFLELDMPAYAIRWSAPEAIERLLGEAVDAPELQLAGGNLGRQALHHPEVSIFVETAVAGGKHQYLGAGVAEHHQLHVALQTWAEPAVVFLMQVGKVAQDADS
jgi:hypothetical protein